MKIPFLSAMNKKPLSSSQPSLARDLESLRIVRPCPKKWEDMTGNDQKRFCAHCNLHVHNLSSLSRRQIHSLAETPGRRCVAYLENPDGSIQTRPRFESFRRPISRTCRLVASLLALVFPFSFLGGCSSKTACQQEDTPKVHEVSKPPVMVPGTSMPRGEPMPLPEPKPAPSAGTPSLGFAPPTSG